jgi:hypothetical protein
MKVGSGLSSSAGTISYTIPDATGISKGLMQAGSGISISSGTISINPGDATTSVKGFVQVSLGSFLGLASGVLSMTIPDASSVVSGLITTATNGGLDNSSGSFDIALATTASKGIIQPGSGVTLTGNTISASALSTNASTSVKGTVQLNGTYFTVAGGVPTLNIATNATLGRATTANSSNLTFSLDAALDVGTNIPQKNAANTYTKAQVSALFTDTFASSYTPDFSQSNALQVTLTGNMTMNASGSMVAGGVYSIVLIQDGTGSRTLTLDGNHKANQTITLSTGAGKKDVLTLICKSSTEIFTILTPGY